MTYITVAEVRRTCGIDETEINDTDVTAVIEEVEAQVPRYFNTSFTPVEVIEYLDGDGTNRLLLDHNPILSVRELKIDGTSEDPSNLIIYDNEGFIYLGSSATTSKFLNKRKSVIIKYIHGTIEESTTSTTSSAASESGTSVEVSVASESRFEENDWVLIYGMDGNKEIAQVTATDTELITFDKLVQDHESGSKVVKVQTSENFKKLMRIIASIALVARIVGQSYDESTGYSLGELRVQKGEPYTQWRETANQLINERDEMMARIINRPYII